MANNNVAATVAETFDMTKSSRPGAYMKRQVAAPAL
jgi:hypothetical protein